MQDTRTAARRGRLLPAAILLLAAVGCKPATGLRAGGVHTAGPVLIHAPMGIERVRFRSRETGVDFEHRQALTETAAGGQSTTVSGGVATTRTTTAVTRSGSVKRKGFRALSPRTWAANVHVDLGRWMFFPLVFLMTRAYVEAQGDVVNVEVAR